MSLVRSSLRVLLVMRICCEDLVVPQRNTACKLEAAIDCLYKFYKVAEQEMQTLKLYNVATAMQFFGMGFFKG